MRGRRREGLGITTLGNGAASRCTDHDLSATPSESTPGTCVRDPWTARLEALLTVPFPLISLWGTGTTLLVRSVRASPTSGRAASTAGSLKRLRRLAQALVLAPQGVAKLRSRDRHALGQMVEHMLLETASLAVHSEIRRTVLKLGDHLKVGRLRIDHDQLQRGRRRCRCRPVLAGEHQAFPGSPELQVRVAEGVDVTGAAQALTCGGSPPAAFLRV